AKCSYGVLQVLWMPPEIESIDVDGVTVKRYMESPFKFRSIKPERFFPVYRTWDTADDYLYVFRYDPRRLITDLEQKYGVLLGSTSLDTTETEPTADLIEYWDDKNYVLVARTIRKVPPIASVKGRGVGRAVAAVQNAVRGPRAEPFYTILKAEEHEYGRTSFWVVQNITNPDFDPTYQGSLSDIDDITGLNMHLNLMRSEQAEEILTNIHRPTVYKSDDHQQDPKSLEFTAGAVYPIGLEEELEPLQTNPQPDYVTKHIDDIERSIRTISFLGDAGFGDLPSGISGVAARISLTPLQRILELKLPPRVYALEGIVRHLLRTMDTMMPEDVKLRGWIQSHSQRYAMANIGAEDIQGQYFATVDYGNLLPRDDDAFKQNEAFLHQSGVHSLWTFLNNTGDPDPDAEITRIKKEAQDPWLNPEKFLAVQQALDVKRTMDAEFAASQTPTEEGAPTA
ncbi:hypothetical protein LCGC14_2638110, partial [marine sediment metagenome]